MQWLGPGPESRKKLPALLLQSSSSGRPVLISQLSYSRDAQLRARTERGQGSGWGCFVEHWAFLQNTLW